MRIVIITPRLDEGTYISEEQSNKIHDWFCENYFEIPFIPVVGMMIDLDDFLNCEEILEELNEMIGNVTINQIVIGKRDIALYCI